MPADFHVAAYSASLGLVTDADLAAPDDGIFQRRNNHLIFSDPLNLISAFARGTLLTRGHFTTSSMIPYGLDNLWPLETAASPGSPPRVIDLRGMPKRLPENEELTLAVTTSAAGPAQVDVVLFLAAPTWSRILPRGMASITARFTATTTGGGAGTWSAAVALVPQRDLIGGVYAIVGGHAQLAGATCWRLVLPRQRLVYGRQMRPGGIMQAGLGDLPWPGQRMGLGEWGRFHTFELPSVQTFGAAGATVVYLDLVYLGQSESLLL